MPRRYPAIVRGTAEYDEVTRILRRRHLLVADLSVTQVSSRWMKGDVFVLDAGGSPILMGNDGTLLTRRRRIRIPRDSFLARR